MSTSRTVVDGRPPSAFIPSKPSTRSDILSLYDGPSLRTLTLSTLGNRSASHFGIGGDNTHSIPFVFKPGFPLGFRPCFLGTSTAKQFQRRVDIDGVKVHVSIRLKLWEDQVEETICLDWTAPRCAKEDGTRTALPNRIGAAEDYSRKLWVDSCIYLDNNDEDGDNYGGIASVHGLRGGKEAKAQIADDYCDYQFRGTFLDRVRHIHKHTSTNWFSKLCKAEPLWESEDILLQMKDIVSWLILKDMTELWREQVVPIAVGE